MNGVRGLSFPFRIDPATGGVAKSSGRDKIRDNLLFLLQVDVGERVLRRDYGAGVRQLVHEPMSGAFFGLVKSRIVQTIAQNERRIELLDLSVSSGLEPGEVEVDLIYMVRETRDVERLGVALDPFEASRAGGLR